MDQNKKGMSFAFILIGVGILIISLFLPYVSATKEQAKKIEAGQIDLWGGNQKHITVADIIKEHYEESKEDTITFNRGGARVTMSQGYYRAVYFGFYGALIGFAVLALILALAWKPIGTLIFALISAGFYVYLMNDSAKWNIMFLKTYQRGVGFWIGWAGYILIAVGAIWMAVRKSSIKKMQQ